MTGCIYLADPEMSLANARAIGACKRAICARHGLIGVFPADKEEASDPAPPLPGQDLAVSGAMERALRSCDAMIPDLAPFRGPSADVGSAYEVGFTRAACATPLARLSSNRPSMAIFTREPTPHPLQLSSLSLLPWPSVSGGRVLPGGVHEGSSDGPNPFCVAAPGEGFRRDRLKGSGTEPCPQSFIGT